MKPDKIPVLAENLNISNYTYNLPDDRIAKYPLAQRDKSKLLVWKNHKISESSFGDLSLYIPEESLLVFNNTRVIHARMGFRKESGSPIEIFCLEPAEPADYQIAFAQTQSLTWKCLVGNAKKWKDGKLEKEIIADGVAVHLSVEKIDRQDDTFTIRFEWDHHFTFAKIVELAGVLPIPPYLNRDTETADETSYQTIFARIDGSVAAPTAGLHFTENVLASLIKKNVNISEITLHVGAGTFQPVKSEQITQHHMHSEMVVADLRLINTLIGNSGKTIAVGTTSVRSLESLYWLGVKLMQPNPDDKELSVSQWEPYSLPSGISLRESMQCLANYIKSSGSGSISFHTQLMIVPGYPFKVIDGMITNFHQPQSTLLLLVSAITGNHWRQIYEYALENGFRFLSYGDANLYFRD